MEHDKYPESLRICERIADHLKCDSYLFESFQVIQYNPNEHYDYHYDAYDINETDKYKKYCGQRGNRIKTVLVYLNDVEEGGETVFPMCGTAIQPEVGKVTIWPTGLPFYHCGNKSGTDKYILTSWFEFL